METETDSFVKETSHSSKRSSISFITSILGSLSLGIITYFLNRTSTVKSRFICFSSILFGIWSFSMIHSIRNRRRNQLHITNRYNFHNKYSLVQNIQQLETLSKDIRQPDHLCDPTFLPSTKYSCVCSDPFIPIAKEDARWKSATDSHKKQVSLQDLNNIQVIFYGDSITRFWMKKENVPIFQSLFTRKGGGLYDAIALGIPGDRIVHLLYRLQNGELPTNITQSSIYWILIGTNDLGSGCPPEVVLVGILRIVEEILLKQPKSTIVINGILPRSVLHQNGYLIYDHSFWNGIEAINHALEEYTQHRSKKQVYFFDARDIFLVNATVQDESQLQIQLDLMPDLLHPSSLGYQKWGEAIVNKLNTLI